MNENIILVLIIAAVIVCGLVGGIGWLQTGGLTGVYSGGNPQIVYVPNPGDCIVLPKGYDPVYDSFYANQVNPANCESFKTQEEGKRAGAEAAAIVSGTARENIGMGFAIFSFGSVVGFLVLLGIAIILKR